MFILWRCIFKLQKHFFLFLSPFGNNYVCFFLSLLGTSAICFVTTLSLNIANYTDFTYVYNNILQYSVVQFIKRQWKTRLCPHHQRVAKFGKACVKFKPSTTSELLVEHHYKQLIIYLLTTAVCCFPEHVLPDDDCDEIESGACQNFNEDRQNAINEQINKELKASYAYMAMGAYFSRLDNGSSCQWLVTMHL